MRKSHWCFSTLHHDSIIELEQAISVCARMRRRAPEFTSSSMAAVLFSIPPSASSIGGPSVDTVKLPASSKTARVFVGSKSAETRQARILREKLSSTVPHSAFRGQTPDEVYFGTGDHVPVDRLFTGGSGYSVWLAPHAMR